MTSTNLKSHLDALASQIAECQQEEIAEPNTWIERFSVTKSNGKRYVYFRLMSATTKRSKTGKMQGQLKCYLGSAGSAKYEAAKAAISRRNHLHHLQKQYQRLLTAQKQAEDKSSLVSGGTVEEKKGNSLPPLTHNQNGNDLLAAEGGHSRASAFKAREQVTQLQHGQLTVVREPHNPCPQQLQAMSEQYEALVAAFQQQQQSLDARLRKIEGLLARERDSRC